MFRELSLLGSLPPEGLTELDLLIRDAPGLKKPKGSWGRNTVQGCWTSQQSG